MGSSGLVRQRTPSWAAPLSGSARDVRVSDAPGLLPRRRRRFDLGGRFSYFEVSTRTEVTLAYSHSPPSRFATVT